MDNIEELEALPLFTRYRESDPDTSQEAAASVYANLKELQREVYDVVAIAGPQGLTDLDISQILESPTRSTYRTRRSELVDAKLIGWTGRKIKQEGRSRRVWALIEHCPAHVNDVRLTRQDKKNRLLALCEGFVEENRIEDADDVAGLIYTARHLLKEICNIVGYHKEKPDGTQDQQDQAARD